MAIPSPRSQSSQLHGLWSQVGGDFRRNHGLSHEIMDFCKELGDGMTLKSTISEAIIAIHSENPWYDTVTYCKQSVWWTIDGLTAGFEPCSCGYGWPKSSTSAKWRRSDDCALAADCHPSIFWYFLVMEWHWLLKTWLASFEINFSLICRRYFDLSLMIPFTWALKRLKRSTYVN